MRWMFSALMLRVTLLTSPFALLTRDHEQIAFSRMEHELSTVLADEFAGQPVLEEAMSSAIVDFRKETCNELIKGSHHRFPRTES